VARRGLLRSVPVAAAPTPEELMAAVAAGDLDAFGELYDRYSSAVHGCATRVLRDPTRAEEVTQEVFLEAWRGAGSYRAELGGVRTWLVTIAHRRAVDVVRSVEASRAREDRAGRRELHEVPGPEAEILADAERADVRRCLEGLTPLQLESVRLAYYDGFSYPQVAARLERPLSTIKSRMADGLARLRDCLEAGA
jgi:RNA polymerase sigma-70 factor (ECF subfamily)